MINYFNSTLKKEKDKTYLILLIFTTFIPATLLMPSTILNAWTIIISTIFIANLCIKKEYKIFDNHFFYLLIFFWVSLIINLFFTSNLDNSILRALGFGKFIIFVYALKYVVTFNKFKYENLIYKIWFIIFCIVTFDLLFQYIFGFNTLGFKSPWNVRLGGFLNQELKIGHYYYAFALLAISYFISIAKNKNTIYLLIILFLSTSLLIGERSNFIKMLLMIIFFILLFNYKNFLKKIIIFIISFLILVISVSQNEKLKYRFYDTIVQPIFDKGITEYMSETQYGAHYKTAITIFKNYPYFGVGLKNFRNESPKDIYEDKTTSNNVRVATHPHQLHLEFLSETGIFGYFSFLIFIIYSLFFSIKNYLTTKNRYQLASILFVIASMLPLIPSGSFFTSYGATIFWINYAIMISYQKK
jgi:O-antigen ligase